MSSINTFQQNGLFQQRFRCIYSSVHQHTALTDTRELQVERAEGQKAARLGFYVPVKGLFPLKMEEQFDPPPPWSGCMNKQALRGPGAAAQGARLPVTALYNPSQHLSLQHSSGTDPSTAKLQNMVKATPSILLSLFIIWECLTIRRRKIYTTSHMHDLLFCMGSLTKKQSVIKNKANSPASAQRASASHSSVWEYSTVGTSNPPWLHPDWWAKMPK